MGVWIEISNILTLTSFMPVTPCVGVWIEIVTIISHIYVIVVTPCVGVWIEMKERLTRQRRSLRSLPAWECGLKS